MSIDNKIMASEYKAPDFKKIAKSYATELPKVIEELKAKSEGLAIEYESIVKNTYKTKKQKSDKDKEAMGLSADQEVFDIKPLGDAKEREKVADLLGIAHAKRIHKKTGELYEKAMKEGNENDLQFYRHTMASLGYDWDSIEKHLGEKGLTDELKESIVKELGKVYKHIAHDKKYMSQIKAEDHEALAKHLSEELKTIDDKMEEKLIQMEKPEQVKNLFFAKAQLDYAKGALPTHESLKELYPDKDKREEHIKAHKKSYQKMFEDFKIDLSKYKKKETAEEKNKKDAEAA